MGLGHIEQSLSSNTKCFDIQAGHLPNNLITASSNHSQLATTDNLAFPRHYLLIPFPLSSGKQDTKSDRNVKVRHAALDNEQHTWQQGH